MRKSIWHRSHRTAFEPANHRSLVDRRRSAACGWWTWTLAELTVTGAVILFVSSTAANAGGLLAPLLFAFAVALFAHEGGYVSRLMKTRPLLLLGTISYSIYLTHIFVQSRMMNAAGILENRLVEGLLTKTKDGVFYSQAIAIPAIMLMSALTILASYVTYRLIEAPGRNFFKRLAARIPAKLQTSHTLP